MKSVKFKETSASVNSKWPKHYHVLEEVLNKDRLTSRELASAAGLLYRNFNKRAAKFKAKLSGYVVARREGRGDVWCRNERWRGMRRTEVLRHFRMEHGLS